MCLYCTSKVLAVCTAIRHLYRAHAHDTWWVSSPCKANTLHLPRPGMHYSGADTGGQQTPLTTGLHPNSKSSNSKHMSLYNCTQFTIINHCIAAYTPCIQQQHIVKLLSCDSRCREGLSITKTCTLSILLEQQRCMLQLHSRQPHNLRTIKTNK